MAKLFKPFFAVSILNDHIQFTNADSINTLKLLTTAGADGANINSISVSNSDASPIVVELLLNATAGTPLVVGSASIPARAGYDGTTSINLLDIQNMPFLQVDGSLAISATEEVSVRNAATLAASETIDIVSYVADFEG